MTTENPSPAKMVLHQGRQIARKSHTVYTTLCGSMNARCADGMNIANTRAEVTCKHCLRKLNTGIQP
jgi:hypothetical protein